MLCLICQKIITEEDKRRGWYSNGPYHAQCRPHRFALPQRRDAKLPKDK